MTKKQEMAYAIRKANNKLAKLGTAMRFSLKIVGKIELPKKSATKKVAKPKMSQEDRAAMFARLREARRMWDERHVLALIERGKWVPTWILNKMENSSLLKRLRKIFCKEKEGFVASLKWTIGSCFNGVKDFMNELESSIIVIG